MSKFKSTSSVTKDDIIRTAAKLVKEDIKALTKSKENYPRCDEIVKDECCDYTPKSLKSFLKILIPSDLKCDSIGQCIVQASRPRQILCPIPFGLGVELDMSFGSKWLIDHLASLGFSITSKEVKIYKHSVVKELENDAVPAKDDQGSLQWVADNVDHNVRTLTGKGTFHGMGMIKISSKSDKTTTKMTIKRCKEIQKTADVVKGKSPEISWIPPSSAIGLSNIKLKPLKELMYPRCSVDFVNYDMLWYFGWFSSSPEKPRPNWSGFMQCATDMFKVEENAAINFLPIIDLNPSDESCIYSTLLFIIEQAKELGVVPIVTFDQPLWLKATGIIEKYGLKIVCRLGGFHEMMSSLGSIGNFMKGSGLEEIFQEVYAEDSVVHMMSGKAVSRAIRAHFLVDSALVSTLLIMIVDQVEGEDGIQDDINEISSSFHKLLDMEDGKYDLLQEALRSTQFQRIKGALAKQMEYLSAKSRTAKLWIVYHEYVSLLRRFIMAERTCNFYLHLECMKEIIILFAATGHIQYAKSGRLYIQQMEMLKQNYPSVHMEFCQGNHAVRRSKRFWAGLWSDLVIEQTLMRSIKSRGGLTRGRGVSESVRHLWVLTLNNAAGIHQAMTNLTKMTINSSEQHVEMGTARKKQDHKDCEKFLRWIELRNPFTYDDTHLHSLTLGLVSITGKDEVNCENVEAVGRSIQMKMDNIVVSKCKIKRKDQVKPLLSLQHNVKVGGSTVSFKPTVLFTRMTAIATREEDDTEQFFDFEMTPEPMSLFTGLLMRKPDKPSLRKAVLNENDAKSKDFLSTDAIYVVDGGALLHRVRWLKGKSFIEVCSIYVKYVRRHYKNCYIVFDGYENTSTKSQEQYRRNGCGNKCPNIDVIEANKLPVTQDRFLTNTKNKKNFIRLLARKLQEDGQTVKICRGDADTSVVSETMNQALNTTNMVVTVADDTDIAIMLLYHWREEHGDVVFFTERSNEGWNLKVVSPKIGMVRQHLLFIHAWSGCDTTSAPFNLGKTKFLNKVRTKDELKALSTIMHRTDASAEEIGQAGITIFEICYGSKTGESLCKLRYRKYIDMCTKGDVQPERMPPTDRSAYFHALRVHHQVLIWHTMSEHDLDPQNWGWHMTGNELFPIKNDKEIAPERLLKVIRCNCKSLRNLCGSNACSCRKFGIKCISSCSGCHGEEDCKNKIHEPDVDDGDFDDIDELSY